eukprot:8272210-Karenia_brevis.AAC.1
MRSQFPGRKLGVSFDYGPSTDIAKSEYFTAKTLPYAKYRNAFGQLLALEPYRKQVVLASDTASYALRRVLPTVASLVLTDEMEKAAVGNWNGQ